MTAKNPGLTVETAAIRIGETVFTLPRPNRHHNVMWWLHVLGIRSRQMHDQGFVLSNGQYVSRTLAAKLALGNWQVQKLIAAPNLYSEDLWDDGVDLPSIDALKALSAAPPPKPSAIDYDVVHDDVTRRFPNILKRLGDDDGPEPAGDGLVDREVIARVIDPEAWALTDDMAADPPKDGDDPRLFDRAATRGTTDSLTKADSIITLLGGRP